MTRIAYLINSVEGGGAALPAARIIEFLRSRGFDVKLFALTRRDGRALPAFEAAGIPVEVRDGGETDNLATFWWVRRALAEFRPDLVWTSLTRATLIGQLAAGSIPLVSWQHAAFLKPVNRRLLRLLQRRSALWIADSESVARLTGERLGVDPDRLLVWPLFAAYPNAPRPIPWLEGQAVRMGSLGRLHPVKGYDVLIAALGRLEGRAELDVTIAGEGQERDALAALARAAGVKLALPGFAADPQAFLAGLHLYVQPSRSEGLCVAAHEAMAAGLPVIGSAVGEMANSIVAGTGLTVPPADPEALGAAINEMISRPEQLAEIGARGRARVLDRFGPVRFEQAGDAVVERIRKILAG
ncbi:MAG: glycosyltransferase [Sphingomicrobium sp.]